MYLIIYYTDVGYIYIYEYICSSRQGPLANRVQCSNKFWLLKPKKLCDLLSNHHLMGEIAFGNIWYNIHRTS
jgi:hypothetical protein